MASTVPAAAQALAVLRHLAAQLRPVPAAAVARELGLPRSTVYALLTTLAEAGFVVHLPEERRWGLGLAAVELGSAYARQAPLARLARPVVARLVDRTGHSGHCAALHGRDVLYIVEERAPGRPVLVSDVDVRLPAHLTASGRALLAALPAAQVRALFPGPEAFTDRTGRGPGTLGTLRRVLVETRTRGHAVEDGEITEGLASVAIAVPGPTGPPAAALALTYPLDAGGADPGPGLVEPLTRAAAELQRRLRG